VNGVRHNSDLIYQLTSNIPVHSHGTRLRRVIIRGVIGRFISVYPCVSMGRAFDALYFVGDVVVRV
jgi:hypothetical protein